MKEDAKEAREKVELEHEKAIEKRREEREKLVTYTKTGEVNQTEKSASISASV